MPGPGGNEGAESTPSRDIPSGLATPMEEDGTVPRLDLFSLYEEPLGLSRGNMSRLRKRKGAQKWVRKLTKMVESMSRTSEKDEVPFGMVAQETWKVIIELDKDGRRFRKDEAKNKKQREKEKRKKAKARAKKKARKERKRRKEEE